MKKPNTTTIGTDTCECGRALAWDEMDTGICSRCADHLRSPDREDVLRAQSAVARGGLTWEERLKLRVGWTIAADGTWQEPAHAQAGEEAA